MEKNSYLTNSGERRYTYKTCFPHTIDDGRISYLHITPDSNVLGDHLIVIANLYDSYEDALEEKNNRNTLYSSENIEKYNAYETEILELEKDMVISSEEKVKRLVK